MSFDFNTPIPRRGTGNIKYDRRPELDPFWVADMDFASCPEILEALHRRVDHGIFGYAQAHEGLNEALLQYLEVRRKALVVPLEHIVHLGGLVPALSLAARAFCKADEAVMTCTPVYPPFIGVHHDAHCELITVDHSFENNTWNFDWDAMEAAVTPKTRIFILCNPQNPIGRVFTRAELIQLAEFCERHDLILVSDEIHCDLILDPEVEHVSGVNLPERFQNRIITLLAPSKTWNIAGLGYAFAVIPDDSVRRRFCAARGHTLSEINALSYYAAEAAYRFGEPWRQELLTYLRGNRDTLVEFIRSRCPSITIQPGQATYLAWINGSSFGNPAQHFEKTAGVFLSDGAFFQWPGWFRFNFGCPRARMLEGLEKIAAHL